MPEARLITGLFPDRESAERAYASLNERGYGRDAVDVVMSDETRRLHFATERAVKTEVGNLAAEGAGIGGAIGGTVGAITAAIAAVGTNLVLPGLGLVVAGPVAAALAGAGAGAAGGGLVGALLGWGIPEERVKEYETGLRTGGILMGVRPRNDDDALHFRDAWRMAEARDVRG